MYGGIDLLAPLGHERSLAEAFQFGTIIFLNGAYHEGFKETHSINLIPYNNFYLVLPILAFHLEYHILTYSHIGSKKLRYGNSHSRSKRIRFRARVDAPGSIQPKFSIHEVEEQTTGNAEFQKGRFGW